MELKGSRTESNLMAAFAGESQARNKYTYYASVAKKAGFEQMSKIFLETADNEKEHAKIWFKLLRDGMPKLEDALLDAAGGEHFEWTEMYAQFAKEAEEEGFVRIAKLFKMVGDIEKEHEERFRKLIANIENNEVFIREDVVIWECANCGHIHVCPKAPEVCPVCEHPKAYFKIRAQNY